MQILFFPCKNKKRSKKLLNKRELNGRSRISRVNEISPRLPEERIARWLGITEQDEVNVRVQEMDKEDAKEILKVGEESSTFPKALRD